MTKRAVIYARVSTNKQTTENQLRELQEVIQRNGWELAKVYQDEGISGSKGRDGRPQFNELLKDAVRKEFDVVLSWSVDRLGRSLQDLLGFLNELHSKHIDLYLHQQGIDTTTPAGKALFQMMGVFAEFERSMIKERIKSGITRAKARGVTLGRPKVTVQTERKIKDLRATGMGIRKVATTVGVGVSVVQRIDKGIAK
ncbi:MAG: recombinase family protein [Kangiellaceae bacterium]